jgi:hypothetical protein
MVQQRYKEAIFLPPSEQGSPHRVISSNSEISFFFTNKDLSVNEPVLSKAEVFLRDDNSYCHFPNLFFWNADGAKKVIRVIAKFFLRFTQDFVVSSVE